MTGFQSIADRFEIEALRGEFTDAVMMRDYGDAASGRAYIQELIRLREGHSELNIRHLPRPLPAHRRRLEVHRACLRGQVPRYQPAGGLSAPPSRGRPLTRRPGTRLQRESARSRQDRDHESAGTGVLPGSGVDFRTQVRV
jgi:hypothetical protein